MRYNVERSDSDGILYIIDLITCAGSVNVKLVVLQCNLFSPKWRPFLRMNQLRTKGILYQTECWVLGIAIISFPKQSSISLQSDGEAQHETTTADSTSGFCDDCLL